MQKTKSICLLFAIGCIEFLRLFFIGQGAEQMVVSTADWKEYAWIFLKQLSASGILVGAAAGCIYDEILEKKEQKKRENAILIGMTILLALILLGSIQNQFTFTMSFFIRMGSYFLFPIAWIHILHKMEQRMDAGGHLIYFWIMVLFNIIYISMFQKAGELLVPYTIYQTIVEIWLIVLVFQEEMASQITLGISMVIENFLMYEWYEGKIEVLRGVPDFGMWHFRLNLKWWVMLLMIIGVTVCIFRYFFRGMKEEEKIFLWSAFFGTIWEILLASGMDGIFNMQAQWQEQLGILLVGPFIAVMLLKKLWEEKTEWKEKTEQK